MNLGDKMKEHDSRFMTSRQAKQLISQLLELAADRFSNHVCNDLPESFFDGISQKQREALYRKYHEWNDDPEEFDPKCTNYLGDDALMMFFADYIKVL